MKKFFWIAFTLALIGSTANAAPVKGGYCVAMSFSGSDSVFSCEHIGKVTISQIYEKGWRVIFFNQKSDFQRSYELLIEEQK